MARKYGAAANLQVPAEHLALVVRRADYADWPAVEAELRRGTHRGLTLEIWDEPDLVDRLRKSFADDIHDLTREALLEVRRAH